MNPDRDEQRSTSAGSGRESADLKLEYGKYAGVGLQFAAGLCLFAYAGYWVDQRLEEHADNPAPHVAKMACWLREGFLLLDREKAPGEM